MKNNKIKKIGFTGTRIGMDEFQKRNFLNYLLKYKKYSVVYFHHGDCLGSDEQAHNIVVRNLNNAKIVIHPPDNSKARANCPGSKYFPEKKYLERNKEIVDNSDFIIATPRGREVLRSGTWSTIRYAKKLNKKVIILYPKAIKE